MELLLNNRCYYLGNCQGVVFMGPLSVSLQKFYRCWVGVSFFFLFLFFFFARIIFKVAEIYYLCNLIMKCFIDARRWLGQSE